MGTDASKKVTVSTELSPVVNWPPSGGERATAVSGAGQPSCPLDQYIRFDGTGHHPSPIDFYLGAAGSLLDRHPAAAFYQPGTGGTLRTDLPNPRQISNAIFSQNTPDADFRFSNWVWQFGQLIDHDLDLTLTNDAEPANIPAVAGDIFSAGIRFSRSVIGPNTGTDERNPRQHPNAITAWIDGSMVYGADPERAKKLRLLDGSGELKTNQEGSLKTNDTRRQLLPYNVDKLPNGEPRPGNFFVAGDIRVNEQLGLITVHTLFAREHNRIARNIAARIANDPRYRSYTPDQKDDYIFNEARRIVIAEIQAIVYNEWLPTFLGPQALAPAPSVGNPQINPSIMTIFSAALFRFHSMIPNAVPVFIPARPGDWTGNISLQNAFFRPETIAADQTLIDRIAAGLALTPMEKADTKVVDGLRNFLFGPPGQGGLDLVSLNIQRGRDHGLPPYNEVRRAFNLAPAASFEDLVGVGQIPENDSNRRRAALELARRLEREYGSVEKIDLFVGMLAEPVLKDAAIGELMRTVVAEQFRRLRDGDPNFYQYRSAGFSEAEINQLNNVTLGKIIARNVALLPSDLVYFETRNVFRR